MTRTRRFQLVALLASVLGSAGIVASPRTAEAAQGGQCFADCVDAVWSIHCPGNSYVWCDFESPNCPINQSVEAYCVWET